MAGNNLTMHGLSAGQKILRCWQLYLLLLFPMALIIIFSYGPMYGLQIAFKNYRPRDGFLGSPWVGLQHFKTFFSNFQIKRLVLNTLGISVYSLAAGFPIPIILAILVNECTHKGLKKTVQMVTFAPYFISTVVMVSMILMFLGVYGGPINTFLAYMGRERIDFMGKPELFKSIYVWTGVWQGAGYSSVIYIAALSGIDPALYEAAIIDGANKFQRIIHIDIPGIMPTIIILLILSFGGLMSVGFEKIYLMQNQLNMGTSDVISTYVYRMGLENAQYSFSTAVGLFNSVINTVLLVIVNQIARRVSETSLW
jgi:putative aldouronate transport system permease protein